jgi:hypothetical protein
MPHLPLFLHNTGALARTCGGRCRRASRELPSLIRPGPGAGRPGRKAREDASGEGAWHSHGHSAPVLQPASPTRTHSGRRPWRVDDDGCPTIIRGNELGPPSIPHSPFPVWMMDLARKNSPSHPPTPLVWIIIDARLALFFPSFNSWSEQMLPCWFLSPCFLPDKNDSLVLYVYPLLAIYIEKLS